MRWVPLPTYPRRGTHWLCHLSLALQAHSDVLVLASVQSEHHRLPPGNNMQNELITVTASGVCSFLSGLMSVFTFISSLVLQPTSSQDRAAGGHLGQLMSDPPNKAVHWAKQQTNWDPTLAWAVVEACQPREWLLPHGMLPSIPSIHTDTHLLHSASVKAAAPEEPQKKPPPGQENLLGDCIGHCSPFPWPISS